MTAQQCGIRVVAYSDENIIWVADQLGGQVAITILKWNENGNVWSILADSRQSGWIHNPCLYQSDRMLFDATSDRPKTANVIIIVHPRAEVFLTMWIETTLIFKCIIIPRFIMHEKCLPTDSDQNISSAYLKYRNGEIFVYISRTDICPASISCNIFRAIYK